MVKQSSTAALNYRVGRRLRALRAKRGWTLTELARATGFKEVTLREAEMGETALTAGEVYLLAQVLEVEVTAILGDLEIDPSDRLH